MSPSAIDEDATLVVRRTAADWHSRLSTFTLFVDGAIAAGLDQDETIERALEPGRHVLQMRFSWAKSRELVVDAEPGEVIRAVVDPLNSLVMLFRPSAYFRFHLEG